MLRLPRFHRLHIFFTGPFLITGLLSILIVSMIAIKSARTVMGRMAQELAMESLDGMVNRLRDIEKGPAAALDFTINVLSLTPREHYLHDEWVGIFAGMLHQRSDIESLFMGFAEGGYVAVQRLPDGRMILQTTDSRYAGLVKHYDLQGNGTRTLIPEKGGIVDARKAFWFQQTLAADDEKHIEWPQAKGSQLQYPSYQRTSVVRNANGQVEMVLGVDVSLQGLEAIVQGLFQNKNTFGFVTDGYGNLVGASWVNEQLEAYASTQAFPNAFNHPDCLVRCSLRQAQNLFGNLEQHQPESFVAQGDDGNLHVAMRQVANLGSTGLVAFAVIPETVYSAYIRDVIKVVFWATLAIILLLILAGYLTSFMVTRPILQLNQSLKRVGRGQWDEIIRLDRNDEIGELSQSFHQMATRLRDLVRNLESLVEERTIDLKDLLEKYAQANRELEKTNATKDRFFSIIAHDLKSPFTALKGYSSIIQDSFDSLSRDQLRSMINRISVSSEEAYGLLENLLQWALVQSGGIRVKWESFDVREVVLEVFDLLKVNAKVKNVRLYNAIKEPLWIEADRNMVSTVLRNIVSNSIKFTKSEEGKVTIQAAVEGEHRLIIIEDNGVGIKADNLKKLFAKDIYFSEKGTGNERGTGLGLGLCKEFVMMNRGQIEVQSKPGCGTTFTTYWRSASPQPQALQATSRELALKILCVDDSEDNHNLLSIFLKDQPWQMSFASNGEEALGMLRDQSYDIILMDLNMPGLSGIQTTSQIRRLELEANRSPAYIIAFTSSVLQADIDAAIAAGCDSYLVKPIKKQKLIYAISRHER
ncbi:MAG: response regulator [Oligoflexus sp.]